jgi:tetratricopeptide (TPR) repeat protein
VATIVATIAALALAGCGHDPADREYFEALRGEETGMTREQQIVHIDRAIQMAPARSYYYETRAVYEIDLRRFDRALEDLDRDVQLSDRPYARFLRGLVRCQAGDVSSSLADFDAAIAAQPANTQFYRGRSLARAASGDAAGALDDAEHLVTTAPQMAESFYARGVALSRLGRDREAIADFDRAMRIRPELVYPIEARAAAYQRLGDSRRADEDGRAAEAQRMEHNGCAACLDPFRY